MALIQAWLSAQHLSQQVSISWGPTQTQTRREARTPGPPSPVHGPRPHALGPVQSQSHNNPISSPPSKPRRTLPIAGPGAEAGFPHGKTSGICLTSGGSPFRTPPLAPPRQSNVAPPWTPTRRRLAYLTPSLAWHKHAWVTRRFILNPPPPPPSSNAFVPTSSNKLSWCQPFADHLTSPLPYHRPVSPNTTHPCPHPDRPIILPHSATLLLLDQTTWRPAGHPSCFPPVVLPTRPCPCTHCTPPPSQQQPSLPPPRLISIGPSSQVRKTARLPDLSASP